MVTECELPPAQLLTEKPDKALARPGVYAILCDANGRYYVGMSKNISRRISEHAKKLRLGKHYNPKLQGSYNNHGVLRMAFKALEFCDDEYGILYDYENKWMQKLDSVRAGMNMVDAEIFTPGSMLGSDARKRLSDRMTALMANAAVSYDLISPTGERHNGVGISRFCRVMGLNRMTENAFSSMMRGHSISHKGWTLATPNPKIIKKYSSAFVLSPTRERFAVTNQAHFCAERNIPLSLFRSMCRGDAPDCDGWVLVNPESAKRRSYRSDLGISMKSPGGEIVVISKMKDFCMENNLCDSAVYLVINGKRPHHKNWRKP